MKLIEAVRQNLKLNHVIIFNIYQDNDFFNSLNISVSLFAVFFYFGPVDLFGFA